MEEQDGGALQRARSGDSSAFREVVERHSRAVFRLAYRMTGNEQDAEDVVQETFLRAWKQIDHYEARSSFSTWLHRIAANCSLDLIRVRKRRDERQEQTTDDHQGTFATLAAPSPAPDRLFYGTEVQRHVGDALGTLTPQERTAFILRHFEGLSIEEIGDALGTGVNATKNSIFRAVQKLRRALEPVVSAAR
jgi:RNA polymerase sigma-70 factor (ECF subfamily)